MYGKAHDNWYTTTTKMFYYLPSPEIHGIQSYQGRHPKRAVVSGSTSDRDRQNVLLGSTSERKTLVLLESSFSRSSLIRVKIQTGQSEGAVLFEPTS